MTPENEQQVPDKLSNEPNTRMVRCSCGDCGCWSITCGGESLGRAMDAHTSGARRFVHIKPERERGAKEDFLSLVRCSVFVLALAHSAHKYTRAPRGLFSVQCSSNSH